MRQVAVVIAPGRGTYNASELGYLARLHGDKRTHIEAFDGYRLGEGQETLTELDTAQKFSPAKHLRGDNASGLIYGAGYLDFLSIDRERFEIAAVTGNSMGWYTTLACAGALDAMGGMRLAGTMGRLMHEHMIGGQVLYPIVEKDWTVSPDIRAEVLARAAEIDAKTDHTLGLSIDLGGMLVLAGNRAGLAAFEAEMPRIDERFPLRLAGHAGFHTQMQAPVASAGQEALPPEMFEGAELPMIDGCGKIWWPGTYSQGALRDYTLGHQVTKPYDFAAALRVAAREFMPDVFIILGPGNTLGGAVAQSLIKASWRGWLQRGDFQNAQTGEQPRLLSMGLDEQRHLVTG